jgi:hypothetical protein
VSHLRTTIKEAVRARLVAAGTLAGANVAKDREWPIAPADGTAFDWLLVNTRQARPVQSTPLRPRRITVDLEVTVRAFSRVATATGSAEARAEQLMLEVEHALLGTGADVTLGGLAKFIRWGGEDPIPDEENLDAAGFEVSFIVTFQTLETSFEAST